MMKGVIHIVIINEYIPCIYKYIKKFHTSTCYEEYSSGEYKINNKNREITIKQKKLK